jgi:hypothetical protein
LSILQKLENKEKRTDSQTRGLPVRSAGELLQPYALEVGVSVAALAGQSRLKATKDGRIPLERNEEILLGVHGSGPNREDRVARVGEFAAPLERKTSRLKG